ncbi:hypothetical protein AAD018_008320 [Aestuariibius insulae]|uniref:hypothetical protein n=1 Tax=Aestuariibius insulae TaxID=2058287 RepID=UPI00345ED6C9
MRIPLFAIALALSACTSVVRSTVAELETRSPVDTDPAAMTIVADLPPGLGIAEGSPTLRLSALRSDTGAQTEGVFVLARGGAPGAETFRVAPADLDRFRRLQAQIKDWKAEAASETKGQLNMGVKGCRIGAGPVPSASLSIAMQLEEDGPVLPLIRPTPIKRVLRITGVEELPDC